ncbi:hypothetical protein I5Q34_18785 [Streptomyces sp. AV19]|uniref:HGxxPAAW family protein n=1 Tax=Streptomyces sp. AV19 TaxID=2793068 RepID=UPI0018FE9128|nr:HGxxPAAW family protein [Streptomyces sp. AV19]MBH1936297.1 hypothetical protein [Streptomyces sp. AV19]MDG4532332.1 hypothetical protein [Streptomyces sp. AV19]
MPRAHHGKTPAAWTGVVIAFIGFCVASVFCVMAKPVGFWAGVGLCLLAAVVGGIMSMMGMGSRPPRSETKG